MKIAKLGRLVARWASANPMITRAHLYGSRARGSNRPDSDLDVAIEIAPLPGDSSALATWLSEKSGLTESLAKLIPVTLDLEWYGGPVETPTIHCGVVAGSVVVYERAA